MQHRSEKSRNSGKLAPATCRNVNETGVESAVSVAPAKNETNPLPSELMERICDRNNLNSAFKRVKSNKGAAGVDGMTVDQLATWIGSNKTTFIESLLNGSSNRSLYAK